MEETGEGKRLVPDAKQKVPGVLAQNRKYLRPRFQSAARDQIGISEYLPEIAHAIPREITPKLRKVEPQDGQGRQKRDEKAPYSPEFDYARNSDEDSQ